MVSAYGKGSKHPSLTAIADELDMNPVKVRKLLITAGVYESAIADKVMDLHREGKTIVEMMAETGLSRASVHSYLPYSKVPYKTDEISDTAERLRLYRKRKHMVEKLQDEPTFQNLWETLQIFQDYSFRTAKDLKFTYIIRGNEIFVNRKSKSITRATVELGFTKALELGTEATGPKKLGCFGASYLYSVFLRFGMIPQEAQKRE